MTKTNKNYIKRTVPIFLSMPGAENHITNKDPSYFFKSQHSINSFSEKEISRFVEQGLIIEGRQLSITWEENGSNKQIK